MTPEHFRQIEELYHAVREGSAEQRAVLLARADFDLRRDVESLLAQVDSGELLERGALGDVLGLLEDPSIDELSAGACLGPYRIVSKIGEGGMGEVFRALDTRLGRTVAIKVGHEQFSSRFEREARAISSLNHPNICTLHDIGSNYLVMEFVEGETLAARLKHGPLPMEMVRGYGGQIASALAEAQSKGVVHRDLKPTNIMLGKSGLKVLDFGLAKSGHDETITTSHMIMGTPAYMAPEQREGKPADTRSDIYSLGCVLYEMATGAKVTSRRKRIPTQLEKIVTRCLEGDPSLRWQTAAELERELAGMHGPSTRKKRAIAAAAATLALSAGLYFYYPRAPKLTDQDTIVLADFANNTGDPIFDGTLRQGLAMQLEQSPFLKVMDDDRAQAVLRLMRLPAGARITNAVAHEVCIREGASATIDGAIASLGRDYVITLQAIGCQNGATLGREQVQAEGKEHVLTALGTAATAMRAKLGESRSSTQQLKGPLEQATTPSLEALQIYSAGYAEMGQGHFLAAVPLFERAIALDPNFAMAYEYLAVAFNNAGDVARSRENSAKAFALIDRVSGFEREYITTLYYEYSGELDKGVDAFRIAIGNYPRAWHFPNDLSVMYFDLGRFEEGLQSGEAAVRLAPDAEPPYRRLFDAYLCLDRLEEAKALAEKVRALQIDGARIHQRFLELAYVQDDPAAAARETQWYAGKPVEYLSFGLQAAHRNVLGQRRESSKLYQRAAEIALRQRLRNAAEELEDADARADALSGNCQATQRLGRPALALALCGDSIRAEKLAAERSKLAQTETIWNAVQLPEIRAAIELRGNHPATAAELLASASPYERAYPEVMYLRGLAYLQSKNGSQAAAEFQKVVDHKGTNWGSTWQHPNWGQYYSLSYLGLARSWAMANEGAKAQKAYQAFFQLWKNADPDIPILIQAKAEYAKLPIASGKSIKH